MKKDKHLYNHLCRLVVGLLLPFTLQAQLLPTTGKPGEVVGSGLTVYNSIVWDNVFESKKLSNGSSHNLVNIDPLFALTTDFFLQINSPAIGAGDKSKNTNLNFDIASVPHLPGKINIGAYENNTEYTVDINDLVEGGTIAVYNGTKRVTDEYNEFYAGTELVVSVIIDPGYRLIALTANGGTIQNGASYILTGHTVFEAVLEKGNGRPISFATAKDGSGKFLVYNSIIYDNADEYGDYSLDKTNIVSNPDFASATEFSLKTGSPALDKANGRHLPVGTSDLAGVNITASGTDAPINAGAYQSSAYELNWNITPAEGGDLEVFYLVKNAATQKVRVTAENGKSYAATTIVVKVLPEAGYILTEIKANDNLLTVTKGEASFELGASTLINAKFRKVTGVNIPAAVFTASGTMAAFKNNIVYNNITVTDKGTNKNNLFAESPVAANIVDKDNHLDGSDPMFSSVTDFRLKVGSPAIDKGNNDAILGINKDIAKNDRIHNGGIVDLGAYESKEESTYRVIFSWADLKDKYGKVYATVTISTADGTVIASGDKVPAGSVINIDYDILNKEHYEWFGQIGLTGTGTNYLPEGTMSFTLEEDTRISVPIRLRRYALTYDAINGGVKVYNGTALIPSGEELSYETILRVQVAPDEYHKLAFVSINNQYIEGAEDAGGYIVTVRGETTITVNCIPIYELDENGEPKLDGGNNPIKAEPKGLFIWDIQDATVTASAVTKGGQTIPVVSSNDLLEPGTVVTVKVKPDNAKYLVTQFEVNGTDMTPTKKASSFELTIPDADAKEKVKPTYIVIRYGENTNPGPGPGPSDPVTNYTLTVKALPDGIAMDPQPGIYTVAQGSSRLFRITVDPEIAANYVYLMVNDEAALIHDPAYPEASYTYLLIDIYRDTEVSVIVREDPDPNTDPTGNTQVQNDSRIWTGCGTVFIETAKPDRVSIYTMQGRLYTEQRIAAGETMIHLPAGVYIVVLPENKKTGKVVVSN